MARKSPSFSQLISYFHKENFWKKAPTYSHNMWETTDPDRVADEFDKNATFLPKRANGNYLYHECIVLGHHPEVSTAKQERILLDLVKRYVELRCPDQMVYGRMHITIMRPRRSAGNKREQSERIQPNYHETNMSLKSAPENSAKKNKTG